MKPDTKAKLVRTAKTLGGALLLTLMAHCANQPKGNDYIVMIDPHFDADQQEAILKAADSWSAVVPVTFSLRIGTCSGDHTGYICTHPTIDSMHFPTSRPESDGVVAETPVTTYPSIDGGDIYFDMTKFATSMPFLQMIAAHEMGHAMGLAHDPQVGTLMNAFYNGSPMTPAARDVAQWKSLR